MSVSARLERVIAPLYIRARLLEERLRSGVVWNPFAAGFVADPYPAYRRLRERDPVHRSRVAPFWIVSRYADVDAVLRDHSRFRSDTAASSDAARSPVERVYEQLEPTMLDLDPPDHTRLRGLVSRAFTTRRVARMEEHIRETAHGLLDEVEGDDRFDLMSNLAALLPTVVIAEMIGVPTEDREQFKQWSGEFARVLEPRPTLAEAHAIVATGRRFDEYFAEIVEQRRADPRDDLLTQLIEAEEDGERLTTREMLTTLRLQLVAGKETTTNLIGNGLLALLRHPEQMELLRREPERITNAIEELLRYDSPVQVDGRRSVEPVQMGEQLLAAGSDLVLVIGGANRDPAEFDRAEELDVTREDPGSISFGRGIHYCLGAPLARLEGKIAFEVLFERFDEIELSGAEPTFRPSIVLRGLNELPIRVHRRAAATAEEPVAAVAD